MKRIRQPNKAHPIRRKRPAGLLALCAALGMALTLGGCGGEPLSSAPHTTGAETTAPAASGNAGGTTAAAAASETAAATSAATTKQVTTTQPVRTTTAEEGQAAFEADRDKWENAGSGEGQLSAGIPLAADMPAAFRAGYRQFSANLISVLHRSRAQGENIFVSPASLYMVLSMAANGANGQTRQEMLQVLGEKDTAVLNKGNQAMQGILLRNQAHNFRLANAMWIRQEEAGNMLPTFREVNETYYGAKIQQAAFDDTLIPTVNRWVADRTAGRITDLLRGPLSPNACVILINTLLFEGEWKHAFGGKATDGVFHAETGDLTLPMMTGTQHNAVWYEDDAVQATRIPFADGRTSLLIALPKGTLSEWMAGLDSERLAKLMAASDTCGRLIIQFPRCSICDEQEVSGALREMGMAQAFELGRADFSGMLSEPVAIDKLYHQAALEVREQGVLAVGASAMVAPGTALRPDKQEQPKRLVVDKPFFCAILDEPTDTLWFGGAIYQPQALAE